MNDIKISTAIPDVSNDLLNNTTSGGIKMVLYYMINTF